MDIILNTVFNNPNLPIVPVPGFVDDFNRPAADVLGETLDGKPWQILDSGSTTSVWGTYGDGTAGMKSASSQFHAALVDGLSADGTLRATLASHDEGTRRPGLALRALDDLNMIQIAQATGSNHALRIAARVGGTTSHLAGSGPALTTGDELAVHMLGPAITVEVNGVEVLTGDVPELLTGTRHGMYAFTGAIGAWEHIEFKAA